MATLTGKVDYGAAPSEPFEVVPPGRYNVQIVASEWRATNDGKGEYLWLEQEILDGPFARRKLWDRLNLVNANAQAVEIANRTLAAIRHATGVLNAKDSEELHFKAMIATVRVQPARQGNDGKQYDASNEVKGYLPITGQAPAAVAGIAGRPATAARPAAAPARAAAPAAGAPPWAQKKAAVTA